MQIIKSIGILAVVGMAAYWLLPDPASTPSNFRAQADTQAMYLCKETQQLIKAPVQSVPATNPKTGRATLYRALHCKECEKWHVIPPPDAFPGNPLTYRCPVHKSPMTSTGPVDSK